MSWRTKAAPLYLAVQEDLFDRIYRGEFKSGDPIPTEEQLGAHYGVSRITVRRALDELSRRGVIVRQQGVGTFVKDARDSVRSLRLTASLDDLLPLNRHEILSRERIEPEPQIAEFLQLAPGEAVDRITALNIFDSTVFAFVRFDIPTRFGRLLTTDDFYSRTPPVRTIELRSGLRLERGQQFIDPVQADAEVAKALQIEPKTALLKVTRVYLAERQIPLEAGTIFYHPGRYRLTVELAPLLGLQKLQRRDNETRAGRQPSEFKARTERPDVE